MSDEVTVSFAGETLEVNLYDPASTDVLATIQELAAQVAEDAQDAEAAAAIALAAAASADYVAARGQAHLAAWLTAAGEGARLLVTADGEKTWRGGDPLTGDIVTLAPLFGPAGAVCGQVGPYFDNAFSTPDAPLYPRLDPAGGVVHTPTTNFTIANGVIGGTSGVWSLNLIFRLPAVSETYASVAAMNADAAAHGVGDIAFVTGPTITEGGFGTIPTDSIRGVILNALPDGGYYRRSESGWQSGYGEILRLLDTAGIGGGQDFVWVRVDGVGKLQVFAFDGSAQAYISTWYTDVVVTPGEAHSLRVDCDGSAIRLSFRGVEFAAHYGLVNFTPNAISLNGEYRTGAVAPNAYLYTGAAITHLALAISEGLDYTQARAESDALAELFGAPRIDWSPVAYIAIMDGQSEYSAPEGSTVGDGNRPDSVSGWNGHIARRALNDPRGANPSQEFIPGVFAGRWRDGVDSAQIGPLAYPNSTYGDGSGGQKFTFSGQGETWDWGAAKRFRQWSTAHLYFAGVTIGGTSLAQITAQGGTFLHSLKGKTPTEIGLAFYRDIGNRQFIEIVDRCHARGQTVEVILLANVQGLTDSNTVGTAAAHAADIVQRWDDEVSKLVDLTGKPPLMLARAANYRGTGTGVETNTAASNWVDDEYRKLSAGKDTGHPIRAITSEWLLKGTFIHPATLMQRKSGEHFMDLACRYWFEGEFRDPLEPVSVTIGAGGDAGKAIITWNRDAEFFTSIPNAPTTLQTGGFNTYGLVLTPVGGGRTIDGAVTNVGNVTKVPISGGGPIAGDRISYLTTGALWGNIREATPRPGLYPDQDWGATIPLPDPDPPFDEGALNDIREGAAAFTWVL